jgi:hypothetical protein
MQKKINIGGKVRDVDFNFNALEEFEELTGVDPLNGLKMNVKTAKALIFCGLKYGLHPEGCDNAVLEFSLKTVGSWLDPLTIAKVLEIYNDQSQPEKKSEELTETVTNPEAANP